ncbi:MAG: hypothetical protein R3300_16610 [Candidatus Promineifilaceae bacterium]|nr:hypothetical protein [Candidatus Promineifilaceae bacterium]
MEQPEHGKRGKSTELEIPLGSVAGLPVTARASFFLARLIFTVILIVAGRFVFKLSRPKALLFGLVAAVVDPLIVLIHQLGHAWAAKKVGWPMNGISFWGLFSTCYYPLEEPELPPEIHLRRAIAGPVVSFFNGLLAGVVGLRLFPHKGVGRLLALFWMVDASGVRGIGALGPLQGTDGPAVYYWAKRLLAEKKHQNT